MRTVLALLLAALAALGAWAWMRPVRAQASAALYVSGMRVDGDRPVARVRLTNVSAAPLDFYFVHYTVRDTSSGIPLSLPGAGPVGVNLPPGRVLDVDLGAAVQSYRNAAGVGPFTGPVQFVAFADTASGRPFGPDVVHVEAVQVEGAARYDGVVHWISGE